MVLVWRRWVQSHLGLLGDCNTIVVLLVDFFFLIARKLTRSGWLVIIWGKIDCFSHVLSLVLFQNGFPQIVFSSWLIFTEWKYHFKETPKASYFRINETSFCGKRKPQKTLGNHMAPCYIRGSLVGMWKPISAQGSLSVFQLLFTSWTSVRCLFDSNIPAAELGFVIHNQTQKAFSNPIPGNSIFLDFNEKVKSLSRQCFFTGFAALTPAGPFISGYASHFPDKLGGPASPNKIPVCAKLPCSRDLYLNKTTSWKGEWVWFYSWHNLCLF